MTDISKNQVNMKDFDTQEIPNWCPGCGNFGIQVAIKMALAKLQIPTHKTAIISGIGCGAKIPNWMHAYSVETLHGRSLPFAQGLRLANNEITVIANGGDGDGYGIGVGHFIHAMRRNIDMVYLVYDNHIYGLTKGQASPTTETGVATKSTPFGVIDPPLNPIALALASSCTFVARGYSGDIQYLSNLIAQAIDHKGFALIDILQICVTFNKLNTGEFYKERLYKLDETDYKPNNFAQALEKAQEWGDKIPVGVFYKNERPSYETNLPQLEKESLFKQDIENVEIESLMSRLV